jgi:hypothetical protein
MVGESRPFQFLGFRFWVLADCAKTQNRYGSPSGSELLFTGDPGFRSQSLAPPWAMMFLAFGDFL